MILTDIQEDYRYDSNLSDISYSLKIFFEALSK